MDIERIFSHTKRLNNHAIIDFVKCLCHVCHCLFILFLFLFLFLLSIIYFETFVYNYRVGFNGE
jgi:hypothetical protein